MNILSSRRDFMTVAAGAASWAIPGLALARPQGSSEMTFAINEAATAAVSIPELMQRYEPLSKVFSTCAGCSVSTRPIIDIQRFLDELETRPEFILAKTVDLLAKEVMDDHYFPLVKIDKPYVAGIILRNDSEAKSLADLIGTDVLLPPERTMTAKLAYAAFRDAGIGVVVKEPSDHFPTDVKDKITVRHIKYQEVISETIQKGWWFRAGVVNPTLLGKWKGKVLMRFKPQPNWSIAASTKISPATMKAVTSALVNLHHTSEGKEALTAMKIERFVEANRAEYADLLKYIKV